MTRLSDAQRRKAFGAPCTPANLVIVVTPWGLRVRAHKLVADRFLYACELAEAVSDWYPLRIDSYACRTVRGSKSTSLHAYGLAWDFFDRPFPQAVDVWGPKNAPDANFLAVFTAAGFVAGADFATRRDCPHIEWPGGLPPLVTRPLRPGSIGLLADYHEPLVKPITYTPTGEATGMRISSHRVDIPALDKEGRGWVDIPYPLERVLAVVGHGSSPPDDGYWPPILCTIQPRGEVARVTLAGQPGGACSFHYKLLEEE